MLYVKRVDASEIIDFLEQEDHNSRTDIDYVLKDFLAETQMGQLYAVIDQEIVVGIASVYPEVEFLDRLYIGKAYRGRGLATELIKHTQVKIVLVMKINISALRVYEKLGFVQSDDPDHLLKDAVVMIKPGHGSAISFN